MGVRGPRVKHRAFGDHAYARHVLHVLHCCALLLTVLAMACSGPPVQAGEGGGGLRGRPDLRHCRRDARAPHRHRQGLAGALPPGASSSAPLLMPHLMLSSHRCHLMSSCRAVNPLRTPETCSNTCCAESDQSKCMSRVLSPAEEGEAAQNSHMLSIITGDQRPVQAGQEGQGAGAAPGAGGGPGPGGRRPAVQRHPRPGEAQGKPFHLMPAFFGPSLVVMGVFSTNDIASKHIAGCCICLSRRCGRDDCYPAEVFWSERE